jgi:opacity protein-like surface antigen
MKQTTMLNLHTMLHYTTRAMLLAGMLSLSTVSNAQTFSEIKTESAFSEKQTILERFTASLSLGLANYGGDLQEKGVTFNQSKFAIGVGLSYAILPQLKVRGEYMYSNLAADDKENDKATLKARNLNFRSRLYEASVALQYDFFDIEKYRITPYVFAGIAYFKASPYTYAAETKVYLNGLSTEGQGLPEYPEKEQYSTKHIAIPFGIGVSYKLTNVLSMSLEGGVRKTFTDYIDDVSGTYADHAILNAHNPLSADISFRNDEINPDAVYPAAGTVRGNSTNKDYYYFGLVKINANLGFLSKGGVGCPRVNY